MTVLLHGFWGSPSSWREVLKILPLHAQVLTPDLYEPGPLAPHHNLAEWVAHFLEWVSEQSSQPVQLVGYSMGARLALNAVVQDASKFSRVLLLSGRPLMPSTAIKEREEWEMNWRQKFLSQPWAELVSAWEEQPVFGADQPILYRRQSDQMREMLGQSLLNWSPRHHRIHDADLKALPAWVNWAYGALDQKYLSVAKSLQELPVQGQISIIPKAGHRLPTDAPEFIAQWITAHI